MATVAASERTKWEKVQSNRIKLNKKKNTHIAKRRQKKGDNPLTALRPQPHFQAHPDPHAHAWGGLFFLFAFFPHSQSFFTTVPHLQRTSRMTGDRTGPPLRTRSDRHYSVLMNAWLAFGVFWPDAAPSVHLYVSSSSPSFLVASFLSFPTFCSYLRSIIVFFQRRSVAILRRSQPRAWPQTLLYFFLSSSLHIHTHTVHTHTHTYIEVAKLDKAPFVCLTLSSLPRHQEESGGAICSRRRFVSPAWLPLALCGCGLTRTLSRFVRLVSFSP